MCCLIPIESVQGADDSVLYPTDHGSAVGECLFVILTQCYCVSESGILSQIKFWDADCFVIHTLCQVVMTCCVLWVEKSDENSTRKGKHAMRLSLTLRSTSAHQTATRRGEEGGEKGRNKREREQEDRN